MTDVPPDLLHRLKRHRQEHVLAGWDGLSAAERESLVDQLAGIDLGELEDLHRRRDEPHTALPSRDRVAPIPIEAAEPRSADVRAAGEAALRRGEIAALLVAGGQGSRLGFDKPKGMYPVGPVSGATLFRFHAEKVLAVSRRYGKPVPFLVMTSDATHADTVADFRANNFFGLPESEVFFFQQGTMPALDLTTGKLLLEKPGQLFMGPNGHGGTLTALADSGLLAKLKARGVKHVFYFQVDNPLVKIADATFVGQHIAADSEASSKVVIKTKPEEKVGVLGLIDGHCSIIEYSDMPSAMAAERDAGGALAFRAGNPAIHLFSVAFLERVTAKDGGLAYHLARKKVPYFDTVSGKAVAPEKENALKFELFIFDALPLADRWLAVETAREDEFAPLKNGSGADSPETVKAALTDQAARWLTAAGVSVPRAADGRSTHPLELSPLFALDADECRAKMPAGFTITGPTRLG